MKASYLLIVVSSRTGYAQAMTKVAFEICPRYHAAVELIGKRWTGAILRGLLSGARRFSEIENSVPDLSARMLSGRLKELEAEGIVRRTVHPESPVRIDYELTPKGRALAPVIDSIGDWAETWL